MIHDALGVKVALCGLKRELQLFGFTFALHAIQSSTGDAKGPTTASVSRKSELQDQTDGEQELRRRLDHIF